MWYEILPSLAVVIAAINLPQVLCPLINYVITGNFYSRSLNTLDERLHYLRDKRLTGNAFIQKNQLDCWEPEPEPEPKKCECP